MCINAANVKTGDGNGHEDGCDGSNFGIDEVLAHRLSTDSMADPVLSPAVWLSTTCDALIVLNSKDGSWSAMEMKLRSAAATMDASEVLNSRSGLWSAVETKDGSM